MKTIKLLILMCAISMQTIFAQNNSANDPDFPPLKKRYLGQKRPGRTPKVFAPGMISTKEYVEGHGMFTPDMKEFYFSRRGGKYKKTMLFRLQYKNDKWSEVSVLSTDINKYRERFDPYWPTFKNLAPFKDMPIRGFSRSDNGTYYFYFLEMDGSGHMSYSRLIDGKYEAPQKMRKEINTGKWIAHPFVAPDESYLMWDAETEGEYGADIYISFRQQDGSWGPRINMGDKINSASYDQRPRVTPDGKYLFFWKEERRWKCLLGRRPLLGRC